MQLKNAAPILALLAVAGLALLPIAAALPSDPTYYGDCSVTPTGLTLALPSTAVACSSSSTSFTASGAADSAYSVSTGSNIVIYISGAVSSVGGSYVLKDTTTGQTIASGTLTTSSTTTTGCSLNNAIVGSGTSGTGDDVASTDTLTLTVTFTKAVTVCTGSEGNTYTPTAVSFGSVGIVSGVPQFPFGLVALMGLAIPALLLVKRQQNSAIKA
jgi:hypothetical protein